MENLLAVSLVLCHVTILNIMFAIKLKLSNYTKIGLFRSWNYLLYDNAECKFWFFYKISKTLHNFCLTWTYKIKYILVDCVGKSFTYTPKLVKSNIWIIILTYLRTAKSHYLAFRPVVFLDKSNWKYGPLVVVGLSTLDYLLVPLPLTST
jgi:hypothetical protein